MLTFRSSMMLRCSRSACTPPPSTAIAFRSTSDAASSMLHHHISPWLPSLFLDTCLYPELKSLMDRALSIARSLAVADPKDQERSLASASHHTGMAAPTDFIIQALDLGFKGNGEDLESCQHLST